MYEEMKWSIMKNGNKIFTKIRGISSKMAKR